RARTRCPWRTTPSCPTWIPATDSWIRSSDGVRLVNLRHPASRLGLRERKRELHELFHFPAAGFGSIEPHPRQHVLHGIREQVVGGLEHLERAHVRLARRVDHELHEHFAFDARALQHARVLRLRIVFLGQRRLLDLELEIRLIRVHRTLAADDAFLGAAFDRSTSGILVGMLIGGVSTWKPLGGGGCTVVCGGGGFGGSGFGGGGLVWTNLTSSSRCSLSLRRPAFNVTATASPISAACTMTLAMAPPGFLSRLGLDSSSVVNMLDHAPL